MNDTPFCRATALKFRNRIKYTKEKNRALYNPQNQKFKF